MDEVAQKTPGIYEYVLQEEQNYRTNRVPLASNWRDWNMYEHVDRSFTLKNSRFYKGPQDYKRPFNNIILPIANVNYRSEGFDVKDMQIYVDNPENYHKSLIARKFNDWWAVENDIDTAIDESVESYFDYGLALVRNVNEVRPEVIQLQRIAFCDQSDVTAGPICLKDYYSISDLLEMKGRWYANEIDKVILMSKFTKDVSQAENDQTKTPGKSVEIYDLEGMMPESWLGKEKMGEDWEDTGKYTYSRFVITFYISPEDKKSKVGVTLFKGKAKPSYKALKRDPIHGRACGRGGIEELFHPQIWTNYSEQQILQMVEATAKILLITNDKKLKNQKYTDMKHGQTLFLEEGKELRQLQLSPINKAAFDGLVNKWEQIARTIGSASDPQLGLNPVSGTPLGTTEIVTSNGIGIHEYRQGKISVFWAEIYRDWTLPKCKEALNEGSKWLDELSLEELEYVAERVATKKSNERVKDIVLKMKPEEITPERIEMLRGLKDVLKEGEMKHGSERFIEALKDEFNDPMDIKISISNKQKNLAEVVSKLNSVFRTLFTPGAVQAIQQNKGLSELLNNILESSGFSPVNFGGITAQQIQPQPGQVSPMQPKGELAIT